MDLKDLYSPSLVEGLAEHIKRAHSEFDKVGFIATVLQDLEALELKARAQLIADTLVAHLPGQAAQRTRIFRAILHPEKMSLAVLPSDESGLRGWVILPLSLVIGQHGLDTFRESMALLKEMTSRFSSEFAIRYFLLADQTLALSIMEEWVGDPNPHVRRLVSEGTRPRLPWAMQLPGLISDPTPVLPILEALRDDEEEYVRRSVANHLNDISKDHPDLVADLARKWMPDAGKHRKKLLRHGCRTLIKQGHPQVLETFGFGEPQIALKGLTIKTTTVDFGNRLEFCLQIKSTSDAPQSLLIDYLLHFKKKKGDLAPKVFKWTKASLGPRETLTLERSHAIRPITTRKYYAGEQALSVRINGRDFGMAHFQLRL